MLSQSSPTLNRFPGLTLKAWALVSGGVVVKGSNVASVSLVTTEALVEFTTPIVGNVGVVDAVCKLSSIGLRGSIDADGSKARLSMLEFSTSTYTSPGNNFFVAVYQ